MESLHMDRLAKHAMALESALHKVVAANASLSVIDKKTRRTYYEGSPTTDAETYCRWVNLNDALSEARALLTRNA